MADKEIDCTALKCPMPVVRISQAMKDLDGGQTLAVEAADPAFLSDIQAWAEATGHEVLEFVDGNVQHVLIKKQDLQESQ